MPYYFSKIFSGTFEQALVRVTEELKKEGFGILTEIDVQATLKKKLDAEFRPYRILGACNPPFAFEALKAERNIGILLPCNVVVQELEPGRAEISAVDPLVAMQAVANTALMDVARAVQVKLQKVIESC
jgi:uncharacterized protein (DUF302 family)